MMQDYELYLVDYELTRNQYMGDSTTEAGHILVWVHSLQDPIDTIDRKLNAKYSKDDPYGTTVYVSNFSCEKAL